jgi:hypothetical protein
MGKRWLVILTLLCLIGSTSCARASQNRELVATIDLIGPLFPPPVGPGQIIVKVSDLEGNPVDNAQIAVRGDMAHAGMVPVLAEAEPMGEGTYQAWVEWTMAGDWVVTVTASLADGRETSRSFNLSVTSEEVECNDAE